MTVGEGAVKRGHHVPRCRNSISNGDESFPSLFVCWLTPFLERIHGNPCHSRNPCTLSARPGTPD